MRHSGEGAERKVVLLSVHRNTRERRRRHEASESMVGRAREIARHKGVAGYVLVAWNGGGQASVSWFRNDEMPKHAMPGLVQSALAEALAVNEMRDSLFGAPPEDDSA